MLMTECKHSLPQHSITAVITAACVKLKHTFRASMLTSDARQLGTHTVKNASKRE